MRGLAQLCLPLILPACAPPGQPHHHQPAEGAFTTGEDVARILITVESDRPVRPSTYRNVQAAIHHAHRATQRRFSDAPAKLCRRPAPVRVRLVDQGALPEGTLGHFSPASMVMVIARSEDVTVPLEVLTHEVAHWWETAWCPSPRGSHEDYALEAEEKLRRHRRWMAW